MLNTCDTIKGKRRGKKRKTAAAESDPAISHSQPSADFARCYPAHCKPPSPATPEVETLRQFKAEWKRKTRGIPIDDTKRPKELLIVDLRDFEVYCSSHCERRAYELTSLHFLEVPMAKKLCFDGFVRLGKARYYIQGVPIQDSSVEGYGDEENPNVVTYVRSELAAHDPEYDIWYRLNEPSPHYKRFHDAFLWVAQMGKHVIDYMQSPRSLDSFRTDFHLWLMRRFARDLDFQRWHTTFRNQVDFRVAVNAYIEYFYHQAYNLPNHKLLLAQPLWSECMAKGMTAIKPRESAVKYTLATPEVHACFKHMYFGKQIQEKRPTTKVHMQQEQRKRRLGFAKGPLPTSVARPPDCQPYAGSPVRVGDVVALVPDTTDASVWRDTNWDWLAYVQGTETLENGTQRLAVLWIYRHHETNLSKAKYPFANEVFLSDNCNCTDGELRSTDIKGKYDIDWSPSVVGTNRFFVRQTYITQESSFVSVTEEHKTCMCKKENSSPIDNYRPGETVYLRKSLQKEEILDPVVVYKIYELKGLVLVRKLSRLGRDYATLAEKAHRSNVPPNEVVLTNQYEEVDVTRIQRRCFVRHVSRSDLLAGQVPFPYNLEGAGDLWIISMRLTLGRGGQNLEFLHALPPIMKQSPDIGWVKKLRGLSLFSGGGSLDRGLEDGGAVKFQTAVDSSANAIHTHRANARNAEKLRLYFGSVDALLDTALDGKSLKLVAQVGEVEFIAAGSPCPGFSALQPDYKNLKSLKNASHISTFCSFVDLYRPLYGILENVVNMASTRTGHENENVLSQVVACLVSMGYQVNQYIMDAWSYGSAQQRSRLIITIAAPGLTPMTQQWHTHSRPYEETSGKSLGKLPNGERFGEREHYPTPFPYVHASTASFGLPEIGNSIVQTCVPYPDHRVCPLPTHKERTLLEYIPQQPPGCGYKDAERLNLIPEPMKMVRSEIGNSYTRIKAAGLIPTIMTKANVRDTRNGVVLHWQEPRAITILEARRAQGYKDHEPIIGNLAEQYKIVGNGVDRKVAFSMGLSLLRAIEKNESEFTATGTRETSRTLVEDASDTDSISSDGGESTTHFATPPQAKQRSPASLPKTLSSSMRGISLPSIQPSQEPTLQSGSAKRAREEEPDEAPAKEKARCPETRLRKQAKMSGTPETILPIVGDSENDVTSRSSVNTSRQSSISSSKTRYTRHSGLSVEFVPRNWNRRVEVEQQDRN